MDTIQIPPDFKEFLSLLNSNDVEYLLIGGFAMGAHGYPRTTQDIDVWIERSSDNAKRTLKALREFGFDPPSEIESRLLREDQIIRMGLPPFRIEILTTISGVAFADCYARRQMRQIDDLTISVIARTDLIANKKASGRPKDLSDVATLEGRQ